EVGTLAADMGVRHLHDADALRVSGDAVYRIGRRHGVQSLISLRCKEDSTAAKAATSGSKASPSLRHADHVSSFPRKAGPAAPAGRRCGLPNRAWGPRAWNAVALPPALRRRPDSRC